MVLAEENKASTAVQAKYKDLNLYRSNNICVMVSLLLRKFNGGSVTSMGKFLVSIFNS